MNLVEIVRMNQKVNVPGKPCLRMKGEGNPTDKGVADSRIFQPRYQFLKRFKHIHAEFPFFKERARISNPL